MPFPPGGSDPSSITTAPRGAAPGGRRMNWPGSYSRPDGGARSTASTTVVRRRGGEGAGAGCQFFNDGGAAKEKCKRMHEISKEPPHLVL